MTTNLTTAGTASTADNAGGDYEGREGREGLERKLAAAKRLIKAKHIPWANAGGPDECSHGYAAGIPCPRCDMALVFEGEEAARG